MNEQEPVTKSILAAKYGLSERQLARLLNVKYFDELSSLGYERNCQIIPPVVVIRFKDIYGPPLFGKDL